MLRACHQKLLCVIAPKGFGEIEALVWLAHTVSGKYDDLPSAGFELAEPWKVLWYNADENDRNPALFWKHFASLLGEGIEDSLDCRSMGDLESEMVRLVNNDESKTRLVVVTNADCLVDSGILGRFSGYCSRLHWIFTWRSP